MSGREGLPAWTRGVETRFAELSPLRQAPVPARRERTQCPSQVYRGSLSPGRRRRSANGQFLNEEGAQGGGSCPERGRAPGLSWIYTAALRLVLLGPTLCQGAGSEGLGAGRGGGRSAIAFLLSRPGSEVTPPHTHTLPPGAAFAESGRLYRVVLPKGSSH